MADQQIDTEAYTWPFQLTKTMHRDVYPAVDPANPQLSAKGKTVLITGGGGTIGKVRCVLGTVVFGQPRLIIVFAQDIAKAWATAHADHIILVGRTSTSLEAVERDLQSINPGCKTTILLVDTRNEESVKSLFEILVEREIKVDVLIDTAASINNAVTGTLSPTQWFNDFEANVKAPYILSHYMMATYGDEQSTVIVMASNAAAVVVPGMSSYNCSKLAVTRVLEFLQLGTCGSDQCSIGLRTKRIPEHPKMRYFALSPGNVESPLTNPMFLPFAKDTGALSGGWTLYLATQKAEYLKGGFLNVNCKLSFPALLMVAVVV